MIDDNQKVTCALDLRGKKIDILVETLKKKKDLKGLFHFYVHQFFSILLF